MREKQSLASMQNLQEHYASHRDRGSYIQIEGGRARSIWGRNKDFFGYLIFWRMSESKILLALLLLS